MRARGAEVTDIVVLVVAADDGVMPQTVEAIDHATGGRRPDHRGRQQDRPARRRPRPRPPAAVRARPGARGLGRRHHRGRGLGPAGHRHRRPARADHPGGRGRGAAGQARGRARGVVLEANLEAGRGPVATVIVQQGTLRVGDPVVAGAAWGKVKALVDDHGDHVKEALPSTPVQVLGFSEPPHAGDELRVAKDLAHGPHPRRGPGPALPALGAHARGLGRHRGQAGGPVRADPAGRDGHAQPRAQGRRPGLPRGGHREPAQARARRREAELRPPRRRRHHRERRPAGGGLERHHHRLQRAARPPVAGDGRASDVEIRTYEIIYKLLEDIEAAMLGMLGPRVRRGGHRRGRGARRSSGSRGSGPSPAATSGRA